ncbi:MAG: hypothetical protein ABFS08_05515 [Pseudomonadota bacterium]
MNHLETIQNHIEITRQQIIRQLQDEISQSQFELGELHTDSGRECDVWGDRVYNKIIARKRQLISGLS